jgi:hypothetical protein
MYFAQREDSNFNGKYEYANEVNNRKIYIFTSSKKYDSNVVEKQTDQCDY